MPLDLFGRAIRPDGNVELPPGQPEHEVVALEGCGLAGQIARLVGIGQPLARVEQRTELVPHVSRCDAGRVDHVVEIAPHHQPGDGAAHGNHPAEALEKALDLVRRDEMTGLRLEGGLPFEQLLVGRLRRVARRHAPPTLGHEPSVRADR